MANEVAALRDEVLLISDDGCEDGDDKGDVADDDDGNGGGQRSGRSQI